MKKTNNVTIIISFMAASLMGCASGALIHNVTTQPKIKIERLDEAPLKFLDVSYKVEDGKLIIEGKIEKTTSKMLPGIFVVAKFYDLENKIIDVNVQHTIRNVRKRRRKSEYSIKVDYSSKIVRCKLEVGWHKQ